jgi:ribonucleotide reductase alpha subunit
MNKAIEKLLHERYYLGAENSWEELAERISHIYPPSLESIKSKTFIPSSPTLMNGNTNGKRKGTLSSCFTMGIEDSIEGIFEALKEAALVTKASGGVGYVFSNLRSSNETIKTINRKSSGPIPFLKVFDKMLDGVSQAGSRKGAGMAQFDITHPDILNIIRLKSKEEVIEKFNISIRVTDDFYKKLKETPDVLHFVKNMDDGLEFILEDNGNPVSVKQLWDEIVLGAWTSAEPGIFNIDIAHRQCTTTNLNDTVLSNPCQPGFATVLTPNGISTIGEINIEDIIWSGKQWTKITNKWPTGIKSVYSYNTSAGSFIGTEKHRIVEKGIKIQVKNAKYIDSCPTESILSYPSKIDCVSYIGEFEVFDITVEADEHTYWSGGLLVSNCAEFVNIPYASCNLGSLNLVKFVKEDRTFDFEKFDKEIRLATRFLDSVIDINDYPLEKIKDVTLQVRPIGLGGMALGDALYKMRIPYNSDVAYQLVDRLFYSLTMVSMCESIQMAKEIGESYPAFDYDLFIKANERFSISDEIKEDLKKYGARNSCFTSIAPNGSISYIAGMLSGGIEPVYALAYSRRIEKGSKDYEIVYIVDPVFDEYLKENYTNEIYLDILEKITKGNGSCQNIEKIPLEDRKVFITANDLIPTEHLRMLAIVAKNTSLSVSKTINMASTATKEDISEVYQKAHDLGVIGVTVYRDGCRQGILTTGTSKEEGYIKDNHAPKRPKKLQAHLYPITVKGNKFGVVVGMLQDRPYEVFAFVDSDNSVRHCNGELVKETKGRYTFVCEDIRIENIQLAGDAERAVTILASQLLRHGVPINNIIYTIKKISDGITDFTTAVARVLTKYTKNGDETGDVCPECGTKIIFENGCKVCKSCGYSGCG